VKKFGFNFNAYLVNRKHWANNLMKKQILHFVENGVHIREEILLKLLNKYVSFYYDLYFRKDFIGKSVEKDIENQFWSPISLNELFRDYLYYYCLDLFCNFHLFIRKYD